MKKSITKKNVLKACVQKQEELIDNFEKRVDEWRTDAYTQDQSASQSEDRTPGKIELLNTYKNELAFAKSEMAFLKSLDPDFGHDHAEAGALIVTNHLNFFIGVSSEKIEVDGEEIFGISTNAPIYKVMEGKKKGDKFKFNEKEYKIEKVI
jgi:hypothetical protein